MKISSKCDQKLNCYNLRMLQLIVKIITINRPLPGRSLLAFQIKKVFYRHRR